MLGRITLALFLFVCAGSPASAQDFQQAIVQAFADICVKYAPHFPGSVIEKDFQRIGKTAFPAPVGAILVVTLGKRCNIGLSPVALNPNGSRPDIPVAMEAKMAAALAAKLKGQVSVRKPGTPNEAHRVIVGTRKYEF